MSAIVIALASHFVRLGFYMGYAPPGTSPLEPIALAQEAERLGYDSAWAAEAWGTDCVSVLAWLGATTEKIKLGSAIMQIPGRTPANTAMTAATLDLLSGSGRPGRRSSRGGTASRGGSR
jgi:alkanesulfonate monooxygenase SsuD/methylene tetrahydromethanopterin reductase-like flavin-dependent oxidoreductase (luciferase family)